MRALAIAWQVAAIAFLLYVLQATIRGWWIQDHADKAYTAKKFGQLKGGESDEACMGLVTRGSLAGGKGLSGPPCNLCGEFGGYHTGQCPVVSFGVN